MKKLQDYVTKNENGEVVFDEAAYNADLDRERNSASETARQNTEKKLRATVEAEIRKQIEDEAKLTAEEKVANERKALEAERRKFNEERIKNLYKTDNLFDDTEIESFVPLITDDYEASVAAANKIVAARKARNEAYEKSMTEKYQMGQPDPAAGAAKGKSEAARRAKDYANSGRVEVVEL